MPTGRAYTFIVTAVLLYLAANQTQVGWLYVTSALILAVVPGAWLLNRRALRGVRGTRTIESERDDEIYHEGDPVSVSVAVQGADRRPDAHLSLTETCPLAPPEDASVSVFVPLLPAKNEVAIDYDVTVDRRGLHSFPDVGVETRAPFGMFQRETSIEVPTSVLVYPEVRQLAHLDLLDRQIAAQITTTRSGRGTEVIGTRPYRPGDSPRHIHWRSVARTGQLISKEFAEETQPGVSLVLDRYAPDADHPKHNPFEWAVKSAVSIAEYARRRGYPVHLHADERDFPAPHGPITWDALMQYTARVPAGDQPALPDLLTRGGLQQFVAVLVSHPDDGLPTSLIALKNTSANLLVVLPDPASFPGSGRSAKGLADRLRADGIETRLLTFGEDWTEQLHAPAAEIQPHA